MTTKYCSRCGEEKDRSEFYKDKRATDGLYSHCKSCHNQITNAYGKTDKGKTVIAKSQSQWYWERDGKEKTREFSSQEKYKHKRAEYRQTDAGKKAQKRKDAKRKEHHSEKLRAKDAVKAGKMPNASSLICDQCGQPATEYHHESYEPENWFDVIPLCRKCHASTYTIPYD